MRSSLIFCTKRLRNLCGPYAMLVTNLKTSFHVPKVHNLGFLFRKFLLNLFIFLENPELYNLEGQVEHKAHFIRNHVPNGTKLHLIGHSVGCYIILNMLKNKMIESHQIHMSYLLFPAIENIGASPNGKFFS
jgi:hypothetical protein